MTRTQAKNNGAVLALLFFVTPVMAGDYSDPTGFSFKYPDGWVIITKPGMDVDKNALPPEISNWIKKNNIDLTKISVYLIRDGEEEFLENLDVVVNHQELPVNDASLKQLQDMLAQQYRAFGLTIDQLTGRIQKIGANEAIVFEYQMQLPDSLLPLRQRQVFFSGGGKTFIVTCTARPDTFATYAPTFDTILASFKIPAPTLKTKGIDWNHVWMMGIVGGVVGGAVSLLIGLIKKFTGKKREPIGSQEDPARNRMPQ